MMKFQACLDKRWHNLRLVYVYVNVNYKLFYGSDLVTHEAQTHHARPGNQTQCPFS